MTSSSQHYALVSFPNGGSNPLQIEKSKDESSSSSSKNDPRLELIDLYQCYAEMYPNPKLIEEARVKDMLLQAASSAVNNSIKEQSKIETPRQGGFFSRWFGKRDTTQPTTTSNQEDSSSTTTINDSLIYTDVVNENDDGSLCGTMQSIDLSCIPQEVYSVARFHLASTRTCREQPNICSEGVVAHSTFSSSSSTTTTTTFVLVGLGEIAELSNNESPTISWTDDRQDLVDYAKTTDDYALHYARATVLTSNCIAVSWGFTDGIIVIYRRIKFTNLEYGWKVVWVLGPSQPVLNNMADKDFLYEKENPGSHLLRISDCLPLQVETGEDYEPIVMTLALARLGGYIELVPLPQSVWNGPVFTKENHQLHSPSRSPRRKGSSNIPHYAFRKTIESPANTLSLTTSEYHIDIISLKALRTSVNAESQWNNQAYPNSPPSEFILCASGMNQDGYETISFWATSTIFSETQDPTAAISVRLHSTLIELISADTGADISVFATEGIMKHWRMPRHIKLKEKIEGATKPGQNNTLHHRVTTITTTAPVVTMRFLQSYDSDSGSMLAVLDWNGGVTILNCGVLERLAAQTLNEEEYNQYKSTSDEEHLSLVHTWTTRSEMEESLRKVNSETLIDVGNLHWMTASTNVGELSLPPLALFLRQSKELAIVTFDPKLSAMPVAFPGKGTAMKLDRDGKLSFVSAREGRNGSFLKHFLIQESQPFEIIQSLARESKFEEAIEAATKLSHNDQELLADVIRDCHTRVWETKTDVDSLAATRNAPYIIEEALSLCQSFDGALHGDLTLETLRIVCKLAISVGTNHPAAKEKIENLKLFLVRLGTYELLSQHFVTKPSITTFYTTFLDASVVELARGLAQRADLFGLTIIYFRHQKEIGGDILSILDVIPLSVDPITFVHLLPLIKDRQISDIFITLSAKDETSTIHWSSMPQYMVEKGGSRLVLDSEDEKLVLEYQSSVISQTSKGNDLIVSVAQWFVDRAQKMQLFVGNLESVLTICQLGLHCIASPMDYTKLLSSPPSVQRLYRSWRSATCLQQMLLDNAEDLVGQERSMSSVHTDDLLSMDLLDLVELVLQGAEDGKEIHQKCSNHLQPLITDISFGNTPKESDEVDVAITSYCKGLVEECKEVEAIDKDEDWAESLKTTVAACAAIAAISKTSIHKNGRLIKDKRKAANLVFLIIEDVSLALEETEIPPGIMEEIILSFWAMYETMPTKLSTMQDAGSAASEMIDILFQDLVGMDILSRWPGCSPFVFYILRQKYRKTENQDIYNTRSTFVPQMVKSFFGLVDNLSSTEVCFSLLHDLLSDCDQLNKICYQGSLNLRNDLADHLVQGLLQREYFNLLAAYITGSSKLIDKALTKEVILDFLEDAVFSDSEDGNNMFSSAITCQDIICPVFEDLRPAVLSIRRCLDASHFINTVIFEDVADIEAITPSIIRQNLPLDMIECILSDVPASVICGSPEWRDGVYSRDSNALLRQFLDQPSHEMSQPREGELPILPGGAIFHLATILGLEDSVSAIIVKCRVIHYAVEGGLQGAAAAVGRTLVRDRESTTSEEDPLAPAKISAIAEIVTDESYADISTKKELCRAALLKFKSQVSATTSKTYETIVQVLAILDLKSSRFSPNQQVVLAQRRQNLLTGLAARLYKHILSDYNTDLHGLFLDLLTQVSDGVVHDSLMNALGRFVIYWCVADSKTLKVRLDKAEKRDAKANLALGCSLILHIPSKLTAINCVEELQKVAADQAASVSGEERFSNSADVCLPDSSIVQRLMGRGYTENASCRAAIMTSNRGYNEALSWAVAHTMDSNFNDPILHLQVIDRRMIDEDSIQTLGKNLIYVNQILKDPDLWGSILGFDSTSSDGTTPKSRVLEKTIPSPTLVPEISVQASPPMNERKPVDAAVSSQEIDLKPSKEEVVITQTNMSLEEETSKQVLELSSSPKLIQTVKARAPPPPPKVPPVVKPSPSESPSSRLSEKPRLQRLDMKKPRAKNLSNDRRRLIEEGRKLLNQNRIQKVRPKPQQRVRPPPPPPPQRVKVAAPTKPLEPTPQADKKTETDDGSEGSAWDFDNFDDM